MPTSQHIPTSIAGRLDDELAGFVAWSTSQPSAPEVSVSPGRDSPQARNFADGGRVLAHRAPDSQPKIAVSLGGFEGGSFSTKVSLSLIETGELIAVAESDDSRFGPPWEHLRYPKISVDGKKAIDTNWKSDDPKAIEVLPLVLAQLCQVEVRLESPSDFMPRDLYFDVTYPDGTVDEVRFDGPEMRRLGVLPRLKKKSNTSAH
jgi:hypothetical protein